MQEPISKQNIFCVNFVPSALVVSPDPHSRTQSIGDFELEILSGDQAAHELERFGRGGFGNLRLRTN